MDIERVVIAILQTLPPNDGADSKAAGFLNDLVNL